MNSRISAEEEAWFLERSRTALWHVVPRDAVLATADASITGELYDSAVELWTHFSSAAPKGVADAKISKVLYLMRPGMFPILDSRLQRLYDGPGVVAAKDVAKARPAFASVRSLRWEAIRRDLVLNAEHLTELRRLVRSAGIAKASEVIDELSDVRILDILSWDGGAED
jgi:hypothetical protein